MPEIKTKALLRYAHEKQGHQGIDKTYKRLSHIYLPRLAKKMVGKLKYIERKR